MMKFSTPSGIGKVRGNQYESMLTYSETVHHYVESVWVRREMRIVATRAMDVDIDPRLPEEFETGPVEELVKISIDEAEPARKLKICSELGKQRK